MSHKRKSYGPEIWEALKKKEEYVERLRRAEHRNRVRRLFREQLIQALRAGQTVPRDLEFWSSRLR